MKKLLLLPLYFTFVCAVVPLSVTFFIPKEEKPAPSSDETVTVFNPLTQETATLNMDDYIVGVVAAEMPASFEEEALKAQAVAARTYTLYKSASSSHEADVCTDAGHCQAYMTDEDMHLNWGEDYDTYHEKIKRCVFETSGEYLTYNAEPVMAVFHSMGGGRTESSADVWGESVPYLQSVESPGEDAATNYETTLTISFDEFRSKILASFPDAVLNSQADVAAPSLTEGGHVASIMIGGVSVPGTAMRSIFELRSTKFSLSFHDDAVTFTVTGYGHGVGMSQYGANAMAKSGSTYREILSHYYTDTTLE